MLLSLITQQNISEKSAKSAATLVEMIGFEPMGLRSASAALFQLRYLLLPNPYSLVVPLSLRPLPSLSFWNAASCLHGLYESQHSEWTVCRKKIRREHTKSRSKVYS